MVKTWQEGHSQQGLHDLTELHQEGILPNFKNKCLHLWLLQTSFKGSKKRFIRVPGCETKVAMFDYCQNYQHFSTLFLSNTPIRSLHLWMLLLLSLC